MDLSLIILIHTESRELMERNIKKIHHKIRPSTARLIEVTIDNFSYFKLPLESNTECNSKRQYSFYSFVQSGLVFGILECTRYPLFDGQP